MHRRAPAQLGGPTGGSSLTSTALFFPVRDFPAQGDAQAGQGTVQTLAHVHTASHPPFAFHRHLDGSGDVAPDILACLLFCSGRRSIHEPPPPPCPANPPCHDLHKPWGHLGETQGTPPRRCWGADGQPSPEPVLDPSTHCCSDSRTPGPWGCWGTGCGAAPGPGSGRRGSGWTNPWQRRAGCFPPGWSLSEGRRVTGFQCWFP